MQVSYIHHDLENKDGFSNEKYIDIKADNESTLSTDLDDLIPNTEYHISVIAYTSAGPGVAANLSVTTFAEGRTGSSIAMFYLSYLDSYL